MRSKPATAPEENDNEWGPGATELNIILPPLTNVLIPIPRPDKGYITDDCFMHCFIKRFISKSIVPGGRVRGGIVNAGHHGRDEY